MGILFDNKTSKYTTLLFDKKPAYLKSDTIIIIISFWSHEYVAFLFKKGKLDI